MTEDSTPTASDDDQRAGTEPMREISHTNPYTDQPFGSACAFERGPTVAADGGERDATVTPEDEQPADVTPVEEQTVEDVSHTPPHDDGSGVDRVFERGTEGRDETV